jgi:hypothetical protein
MGMQAGEDVLDVFYGEHDATYAQRVRRCVRLSADRRRRVELRQLKPAVTVRSPQIATSSLPPSSVAAGRPGSSWTP